MNKVTKGAHSTNECTTLQLCSTYMSGCLHLLTVEQSFAFFFFSSQNEDDVLGDGFAYQDVAACEYMQSESETESETGCLMSLMEDDDFSYAQVYADSEDSIPSSPTVPLRKASGRKLTASALKQTLNSPMAAMLPETLMQDVMEIHSNACDTLTSHSAVPPAVLSMPATGFVGSVFPPTNVSALSINSIQSKERFSAFPPSVGFQVSPLLPPSFKHVAASHIPLSLPAADFRPTFCSTGFIPPTCDSFIATPDSLGFGAASPPPPPAPASVGFGASSKSVGFKASCFSRPYMAGGAGPPPPPSVEISSGFGTSFSPVGYTVSAPPPPPPSTGVSLGAFPSYYTSDFRALNSSIDVRLEFHSVRPTKLVRDSSLASSAKFRAPAFQSGVSAPLAVADTPIGTERPIKKKMYYGMGPLRAKKLSTVSLEKIQSTRGKRDSITEQCRRPDRINWEELFNLQHQVHVCLCTSHTFCYMSDMHACVHHLHSATCTLKYSAVQVTSEFNCYY